MIKRISLYASPELYALVGSTADHHNLSMNEWIVRVLAKEVKRPDLSTVPRKRLGRPRKELDAARKTLAAEK